MVRKFLPAMIEQKKGHILGICSSAGKHTLPYAVPYCASKFGTTGFYRYVEKILIIIYICKNFLIYSSLYDDLCINKYNEFIKVTTAFPGFINTRRDLEKLLDDISELIPRVEADYAAEKIVDAMLLDQQEILFPFLYRLGAFLE